MFAHDQITKYSIREDGELSFNWQTDKYRKQYEKHLMPNDRKILNIHK